MGTKAGLAGQPGQYANWPRLAEDGGRPALISRWRAVLEGAVLEGELAEASAGLGRFQHGTVLRVGEGLAKQRVGGYLLQQRGRHPIRRAAAAHVRRARVGRLLVHRFLHVRQHEWVCALRFSHDGEVRALRSRSPLRRRAASAAATEKALLDQAGFLWPPWSLSRHGPGCGTAQNRRLRPHAPWPPILASHRALNG